MKTFQIINLGCPKNLTDAEEISYNLKKAGYDISNDRKTEIAVINTCAFLKSAIKESKDVIREFIKLKKEKKIKKIIVSGCLVERIKEKLLLEFPEIDNIIGINSISKIKEALQNKKADKSYILPEDNSISSHNRLRLTVRHSAYIKIADGCNNNCSYCAIPQIRGRLRSKPIEQILSETDALADSGAIEISLIAQDTTSYGLDLYKKPMLKSLLKKLVLNKKIKWLRLMYMYPDRIDAELLKIIRDNDVICHYMEMPIQHISDNILKKMNRTSDEKTIRNKIELIKKIIPDMALRTSFIVGFPTENEKDFNKLINFVEETKFNNLAIFKYSREYSTKAYSIEKQIPYREKNLRYKYLLKTQSRILDKINLNLIDKKLDVLIDYGNIGRTYMDAPEIDGKVYIKNASPKSGNIIKAKIIAAQGYNREAVKM